MNIQEIWLNQAPKNNELNYIEEFCTNGNLTIALGTNFRTDKIFFYLKIFEHIKIPDFTELSFKGFQVFTIPGNGFQTIYIHLTDSELAEIFIKFIQDIVNSIFFLSDEIEAISILTKVIVDWKKLFDKAKFNGLTLEEQRGLIGELLFIKFLIDKNVDIENILQGWTGQEYNDKDFLIGENGYEIKFTVSKNPELKISSERQLDDISIDKLYISLYIAEEVIQDGITLNVLISEIKDRLIYNHIYYHLFQNILLERGYNFEDHDHYNRGYKIKNIKHYKVNDSFPRLIPQNISPGLRNITYSVELSSILNHEVGENELFN